MMPKAIKAGPPMTTMMNKVILPTRRWVLIHRGNALTGLSRRGVKSVPADWDCISKMFGLDGSGMMESRTSLSCCR